MKKLAYISTLIFALVLMNTSCTKPTDDTPVPAAKTLAQTYPTWVNLKWEGTDNDYTVAKYPKLTIAISGDVVTVTKKLNSTQSIIGKYSKMTDPKTGTVTFTGVVEDYNGLGATLTCTNVGETVAEVSLTCLGNNYLLMK